MNKPVISGSVEGRVDEIALQRILLHMNATPGNIYLSDGKNKLLHQLPGYNRAAQYSRWIVLIDLDQDADCVIDARQTWLPQPSQYMCFRIVVHEIEAWFLADPENLARFFAIQLSIVSKVARFPETILNPKQVIVNLAQKSPKKDIRMDIVPRPGSGRSVGPAYVSQMIEFVTNYWQPGSAASNSESLERCLLCLQSLINLQIDGESENENYL